MHKLIVCSAILINSFIGFSQEYKFKDVINLECSSVKSQGNTGTCWSFSTSSFLESEIKRITNKTIDLSEMYTVRNTYPKKAWNYVMRQGKAQFSEGGLVHDVLKAVDSHGLVPEEVFSGITTNVSTHNHAELVAVLKGMLEVYITNPAKKLSPRWKKAIQSILDVYLGENPNTFTYQGNVYTPKSFQEMTQIIPDNYVTLTSFTHQPFYKSFILNIPDNFSNGSMLNIPLNDLEKTVITALKNGYTVALDIDVSEKTFSSKHGVAIIPESDTKSPLEVIRKELKITQEFRQQEFENYHTTDDHLMHITGLATDQNGTVYFKTKNSWGNSGKRINFGGYVYISTSFLRLKAISVTVHKNALPKKLQQHL